MVYQVRYVCSFCCSCFFFFKQKTAYEMRISDWSSDVCSSDLRFRRPIAADGPAITALIAACPPLDRNSRYCNLLQCEHFTDHCVIAEKAGRIVGWVSGYRPPSDPAAFFVWQVAVSRSEERGVGKECVSRCRFVGWEATYKKKIIQTTITN